MSSHVNTPPANLAEPLVRARFCQEWLTLVGIEEEPYRSRFFARVTEKASSGSTRAVARKGTWLSSWNGGIGSRRARDVRNS